MMTSERFEPVVHPREPQVQPASSLTTRQRELLELLSTGVTQREAAHRLGISPETVRHTLGLVYRNLDTSSLVGAFRVLGWVAPR